MSMTDEELSRIEGIFSSPASASIPRELALSLCAEIRRLKQDFRAVVGSENWERPNPGVAMTTAVIPIPEEHLPVGLPKVESGVVGTVTAIDHEAKTVTVAAPAKKKGGK
jgi:hypothetical protein